MTQDGMETASKTLQWAQERLVDLGLELTWSMRLEAAAMIAPVSLDQLADLREGPFLVGKAWSNALRRRLALRPGDLLLLLLVHRLLEEEPSVTHEALKKACRHSQRGTWIEVHFRLNGILYYLAKEHLGRGEEHVAQQLLRQALRECAVLEAIIRQTSLPDHKLRIFYGMRGVSRLLLARPGGADVVALLDEADADLTRSADLGDTTAEHFEYHIEVLNRLVDHHLSRLRLAGLQEIDLCPNCGHILDGQGHPANCNETGVGELAALSVTVARPSDDEPHPSQQAVLEGIDRCAWSAQEQIKLAMECGHDNRELRAARGDVAFRQALVLDFRGDVPQSMEMLRIAVEAFDLASELPSTDGCPDNVLALKRGQARIRLFGCQQQLSPDDNPPELAILDQAIVELEQGTAAVNALSYPSALIGRARLKLWLTEQDGATRDMNAALLYLRRIGWVECAEDTTASESTLLHLGGCRATSSCGNLRPAVVRLLRRINVLCDELALRQAMDAEDSEAMVSLLERLVGVEDEPVHGGVLAHAARSICRVRERQHCGPLLMQVSLRLEQQATKVRRSARRGFLASHAATLSVLASEGSKPEVSELRRIHGLFVQALSYTNQAAPELLHHAGVATLSLGKALLGIDERDREEALGLLRDAATLFEEALAHHQQEKPTISPELDEFQATASEVAQNDATSTARPEVFGIDAVPLEEPDMAFELDALLLQDSREQETSEDVTLVEDEGLPIDWGSLAPPLPADQHLAVLESRLGECHVRVHAVVGTDDSAAAALTHLARSYRHGNRSPELLGLAGDVFYRRGRTHRRLEDLHNAVLLKRRAREAGSTARENWSVSAAAHRSIYEISGELSDLAVAISLAVASSDTDPSWPWPLFQLADLATLPSSHLTDAGSRLGVAVARNPLANLTVSGNSMELRTRACKLLVRAEGIRRKGLGGKRPPDGKEDLVYSPLDLHRLLSTTVVVKETRRKSAANETTAAAQLRRWVIDRGLTWLRVPEAIAIVELPEERKLMLPPDYVGLVIQYASGRPFSGLLEDELSAGAPALGGSPVARNRTKLLTTRRILRALAAYHEWRGLEPTATKRKHNEHSEMTKSLTKLYETVSAEDLEALWREVADLPLLGKRDAHADNWLVPEVSGGAGWVALIDLETTRWLPVLFEVAQLFEDFPLFPVTPDQFDLRLELAQEYLGFLPPQLKTARFKDADYLRSTYETFALDRAVFLLNHLDKKDQEARDASGIQSTGSRRMRRARRAHAESLLYFLAESGRPLVRRVAREAIHSRRVDKR
jgi:hypothetical protein